MKEWWKLESKSNHLESGQEASRDLGSFIASPLSKTTARGSFWDNMGNFKYVCTKVLCLGRKKSGWFNLKWYSFENVLFCYVNVFKEEKSFSYHEINNEVDYKKATKCVWERETERKRGVGENRNAYIRYRNTWGDILGHVWTLLHLNGRFKRHLTCQKDENFQPVGFSYFILGLK